MVGQEVVVSVLVEICLLSVVERDHPVEELVSGQDYSQHLELCIESYA